MPDPEVYLKFFRLDRSHLTRINPDDVKNLLNWAKANKLELQVVNLDALNRNLAALISAIYHGIKASEKQSAIAHDVALEILLYAARTTQIQLAIKNAGLVDLTRFTPPVYVAVIVIAPQQELVDQLDRKLAELGLTDPVNPSDLPAILNQDFFTILESMAVVVLEK